MASTTPRALAALARTFGPPSRVEPADAAALGWDEVPPDARLEAVSFGDGARVGLRLHARRGAWFVRRTERLATPPPREVAFVGVLEDALVFSGDDDDTTSRAFDVVRAAQVDAHPLEPFEDGLGDGFVPRPVLRAGGVAEWGPFAHAVPPEAAGRLLAVPSVRTAILRSTSAEADGERQLRIAHRD